MSYIILDLEWNNTYFKKENRFINEILQIGAVKLNDKLNIVDSFQVIVKSFLTKRLSSRVKDLTGITNEEMLSGVPLHEAVKLYNDWVGNDAITMTWSNSDLYAILENSRVFLENQLTLKIEKYVNLQAFVQNELRISGVELKNQISLNNAATLLNVSTEGFELHNAKDDSALAALLLKRTYNEKRFSELICDTTDPEFYGRLTFKPYYLSNVRDERINKNYLIFSCPNCEKPVKRINKWKYRNNWLRAEFYCKFCDIKLKGMISAKQTFNKVIIKKRILPISSLAEEKATKNVKM